MINKITTFLKEVRVEMKKVNWPNRQETIRYTLIVVAASLVVAIFLGSMDFIFAELMHKYIIN